jgi:hypothetical protein
MFVQVEPDDGMKKIISSTIISTNTNGTASWVWLDGHIYGNAGNPIQDKEQFIPVKIIYNCPATICFFSDGTKEMVKCTSDEEFIKEVGVMSCIMKKIFKSRNAFKKLVKTGYENMDGEIERHEHNLICGKKDQWE